MSSVITHKPIGDLVAPTKTWNPVASTPDSLIKYIDISSVNRDSKSIERVTEVIGSEAPSRARQLVKANDILVSTVRPNLNAVAQVPEHLNGATASTGFAVLRANEDRLCHRFLFHWVKSPDFVSDMVMKSTGASYPAVSDRIVKDSKIPLPLLAEQKRIAAILDKADALCEKRRQAIAKLDTLLQSVFLNMFGDPVMNPNSFPTYNFGDLILEGPTNGLYKQPSEIGSGTLLLDNKGLYRGLHANFSEPRRVLVSKAELQKYALREGDIIVNRVSVKPEGVGKTVWVDNLSEECVFESNMMRIRLKRNLIRPEYIVYFLNLPKVRQQVIAKSKLANQASVNQEIIKSLLIHTPPLKLQDEFAEHLARMELLKVKGGTSLQGTEKLFQSLQHRAFSGEL